jgi:molybdenum cofactor biosynthesis enzyme MoaA
MGNVNLTLEKASMRPKLDYLWLEITANCNLNCKHCYAESGPDKPLIESLSLNDWISALEEAAALGCRKVQFIGGEPTIHPDLPQLISTARSLGFESVEIYTNGTLFNSHLKEVFLRHRVALAFSVYSNESTGHEAVTLRPGSFNRTMESIRWAVHERLPVRVGIVEMDANQGRGYSTKRHLHEIGVKHVRRDRLRGVGRGNVAHTNDSLRELCGSCVKDRLCVTANGMIYPCVFSRWRPVGDFKNGLAAALSGKNMSVFRDDMLQIHRPMSNVSQQHLNSTIAEDPDPCNPDQDPGPCNPEQPSAKKKYLVLKEQSNGLCNPDIPPIPCNPEVPPVPCNPEVPPVPCNPEVPPVPCNPPGDLATHSRNSVRTK